MRCPEDGACGKEVKTHVKSLISVSVESGDVMDTFPL